LATAPSAQGTKRFADVPPNAVPSILLGVPRKTTSASLAQFQNAPVPMPPSPSGNEARARLEQPSNALPPMLVSPAGNDVSERLEQFLNA
jgi:hypothetical protein